MNDIKKRPGNPFDYVYGQSWQIVFWGLYHVFTLLCVVLGLFYGVRYMQMRDRVLFQDINGNLFYGYTTKVICKEVINDIAKKAVTSFLNVSYLDKDKQSLDRNTLFTKSACNALHRHQKMLESELIHQKITQTATLEKMQILPCDIENCVYVKCKGGLYRTGEYMDLPYQQLLNYEMLLMLYKTGQSKEFPMRVRRVQYIEKAVYSTKKNKENTKEQK